MDVQTTTVPGVIMSKFVKFVIINSVKLVTEKETTEILVLEPLIYIHLAMLYNMVGTS